MKNGWKKISTPALKQPENKESIKKVAANIEKIGGNIWKKNEHHRAYFPDWMNLEVASTTGLNPYAQPFDAYIDLKNGYFFCDVSENDWKSAYNKNNEKEYWEKYRELFLVELKNLKGGIK